MTPPTPAAPTGPREFTPHPITLHRLEERRVNNRRPQSARVPSAPWKRATQTRGVRRLGVPVPHGGNGTFPPGTIAAGTAEVAPAPTSGTVRAMLTDAPHTHNGSVRTGDHVYQHSRRGDLIEAVVTRPAVGGDAADGGHGDDWTLPDSNADTLLQETGDTGTPGARGGPGGAGKAVLRMRAIHGAAGRVQQRYFHIQRKISALQADATREASEFESLGVWMEMTAGVAHKASHNTSGKLLRVSAAQQILERLAESLSMTYGKWIRWALVQFEEAIFYAPETAPPRPAIADAVERSIDWGPVGRAYFQRYTHALVAVCRWEEQNHRQALFRKLLCPVLQRSAATYQRQIKSLHFNAWRCYKHVSHAQGRSLARKIGRFFTRQRLRWCFKQWRLDVIVAKARREVHALDEENRVLKPQIRSLNIQVHQEKMRALDVKENAAEQAKVGSQLHDKQLEELRAVIQQLQAEKDEERRQHEATRAEAKRYRKLLTQVFPGWETQQPPSREVLWHAHRLKDALVECKASNRFPLVQAKGVERLVMAWIGEQTGAGASLTLNQLVAEPELISALLRKVAADAPRDIPWHKQLFAALAVPAYQAAPMSFLCPTGYVLALVGAKDFTITMMQDAKLLRALSALFVLRVCFAHMHADALPLTSVDTGGAPVRVGSAKTRHAADKTSPHKLPSLKSSTALVTPQLMKGDPMWDDTADSPESDEGFMHAYDQIMRTMSVPEALRAWMGVGTLVSMFLNKLKQRQCVAAIQRPGAQHWEELMNQMQSAEMMDEP